MTHRSYVNETSDLTVSDNERLEFLGDAVLDLVVSAELMKRFPHAREGTMSRIRASMVNENGLAKLAREIDLGSALSLVDFLRLNSSCFFDQYHNKVE